MARWPTRDTKSVKSRSRRRYPHPEVMADVPSSPKLQAMRPLAHLERRQVSASMPSNAEAGGALAPRSTIGRVPAGGPLYIADLKMPKGALVRCFSEEAVRNSIRLSAFSLGLRSNSATQAFRGPVEPGAAGALLSRAAAPLCREPELRVALCD
eukprot:CAMPEP_0180478396 /NCGR_PEP_ID=MMETSP1036_2-20121128/32757_1 /TAXON_ID=632150 /ORGANISM="Azadinium spinosum, Strain 3D9" /LENGTH=153 /DNA_ID=CAMNT_0022485915 /DNA_START=13 /DNA_END=474 /DNA_ORIENTATION=+